MGPWQVCGYLNNLSPGSVHFPLCHTAAKAEAPILWPPDVKSRLIGKDPDAGKD